VIILHVMEEGSVTKVLNDFLTVSEGEIAVRQGDIVQVSSEYFALVSVIRLWKNYST
jgi:hypothetical protein